MLSLDRHHHPINSSQNRFIENVNLIEDVSFDSAEMIESK